MDLREMLIEHGYEVAAEARNGEEAIELAHRYKPELMLMDVKMPGRNGIQATRAIQKMSVHWQSGTPAIILLTAYSDRSYVEEATKSGVTAYLVKPVSEHNLIPAIEVACSQREQFMQVRVELQDLRQSLEDRKWIERAKGRLMQVHGYSEDLAYEWLREHSMNERKPMVVLAQQLILAHDLQLDPAGWGIE
jgi:response regulator NasT